MSEIVISKVRVRYCETDQMGIVHHGHYTSYLEIGRTDFIKNRGVSYKELEERGILMPVTEIKIMYKLPAFYDDELEIQTCLKTKPAARIVFNYKILNKKGETICIAESTNAFVDKNTGKPCKSPQFIREIYNLLQTVHNSGTKHQNR